MDNNIFMEDQKPLSFEQYLQYDEKSRSNLGETLPVLGETVCNYDEGFLSGILSVYTGKPYAAIEIDCWATGDRVCRFRAEIVKSEG